METEFLKTLWMLRFEKMRNNEEEAAWAYQEILDDCMLALGEDDKVVKLLHQLVKEERGHMKLAEELIKICARTHPECGLL